MHSSSTNTSSSIAMLALILASFASVALLPSAVTGVVPVAAAPMPHVHSHSQPQSLSPLATPDEPSTAAISIVPGSLLDLLHRRFAPLAAGSLLVPSASSASASASPSQDATRIVPDAAYIQSHTDSANSQQQYDADVDSSSNANSIHASAGQTPSQPFTFNIILGAILRFKDITDLFNAPFNNAAFIPTDGAFQRLNASWPLYYEYVFGSKKALKRFIQYHVLDKQYNPVTTTNQRTIETTLSGDRVRLDVTGGVIQAGSGFGDTATVVGTMSVYNGSVYVVDNVLVPPKRASVAAVWKGLDRFVAYAASAPGLVAALDDLRSVTIFAPIDSAFTALTQIHPNLDPSASLGLISAIVSLHISRPRTYFSTIQSSIEFRNGSTLQTALAGQNLTLTFDGSNAVVSGEGNTLVANIVETDILVAGGSVMHLVDLVLLPSSYAVAVATLTNTTVLPTFA
ncbi:hypothetical protein BC831DRAFT_457695 [Entophlyctis helioformis]|nr:hypothetical protein BC831DRAFT_457596 [Entophlyctis helioformis]KAI8926148.1 hypothetical protein BC831DRAFT_457695 [Entophlyctis helioformis]